jgi:uncharacterized protein YdcH (DUF465 family)
MRVKNFRFFQQLLNLFFFVRCWAEDPNNPGGGGGGDELKFSGKFAEIPDPKSGNKIKVPEEIAASIKEIIGHSIATTREKVKEEFNPLLESLKSDNADLNKIREEYDKLKEASMTAEQRAEANAAKAIKEHEKAANSAREDLKKWKSLFEKSTIRTDIFSAFGDAKLFNPGQVSLLFESEGKAKISEKVDGEGKPTGEFETIVTLTLEDKDGKPEVVEGTPGELFKRWIELERNFYLRQVDLSPGGGSPPANKGNYGRVEWDKLKPSDRLTKAREQGVKR